MAIRLRCELFLGFQGDKKRKGKELSWWGDRAKGRDFFFLAKIESSLKLKFSS